MKLLKLIFCICSLFILYSCAQKPSKIAGDWVEIRREERSGSVYTIGGVVNEPSIEISFNSNREGTFFNRNLPPELEPKATMKYTILGDSLLMFGKIYELVKIEKDTLILIRRSINSSKSRSDHKMFFLKKEKYDKLSEQERKRLAAPNEKDAAYLKTIEEWK